MTIKQFKITASLILHTIEHILPLATVTEQQPEDEGVQKFSVTFKGTVSLADQIKLVKRVETMLTGFDVTSAYDGNSKAYTLTVVSKAPKNTAAASKPDDKDKPFDYGEWKNSKVKPRKPANHKDAKDLNDAQKKRDAEREENADLTPKQKKLDINEDGKIDGADLKKVREGEKPHKESSSPKTKEQSFLDEAEDFGYSVSELPEHDKYNHEVGQKVLDVRWLKEGSSSSRSLGRVGTLSEAVAAIKKHATTNEPGLVRSGMESSVAPKSSTVESRIKGAEEYQWCQFTGSSIEATNDKGRTLILKKGEKYGARKSSTGGGKFIRLVTEKDGMTKVFTCDQDLAAYLGKNSKACKAPS